MNTDIENILNQYNDVELAFFAKYRMLTYLPETRKQIQHKLNEKDLTKNRIETICSDIEFNPTLKRSEPHCPRCFSNKFFYREEEIENTSRTITEDSFRMDLPKLKIKMCEICGYDINKGEKIGNRIFMFLKKVFEVR